MTHLTLYATVEQQTRLESIQRVQTSGEADHTMPPYHPR